ncbi:hypothetical protein SERLA73DRAFT_158828 [Serpula lacrymans var. lacrymans S7.3]|uniref:Xylanolytic transcriptional activator regulatory domain-containing protein n=1 Tax=Serpula lacrymans var. lacrymans (strain S7.3) TaxID=936435 RepID=F8PQE0_SERL3|nr:hypothetical protein SERLA73DRAFT_158828 [Serpula lacrymans var. lacrymans S7.3]
MPHRVQLGEVPPRHLPQLRVRNSLVLPQPELSVREQAPLQANTKAVLPQNVPEKPSTANRAETANSSATGTIALCYQDARGHDPSDAQVRGDDPPISASRIDPLQEINRLRHSASLLESYFLVNNRGNISLPPNLKRPADPPSVSPKKEPAEADLYEKDNAPGPTSAVTHLSMNDNRQSEESGDRQASQEGQASEELLPSTHEYDRDLLNNLPSLETIDGLVDYYFEYCNWIYRHVNQTAFTNAWARFKTGASPDRIVLATVCLIMAVAVHYLPPRDPLVENLHESHEELGRKFHDVMLIALSRHRAESRAYSLELVELLLIRSHYLTLVKTDSEEVWTVRGELITIGVAMGLHRDPYKWRMSKETAERRRWAWWHIILLERWQAFMFGRPITIASHHYDTLLPAQNESSRLYLPNIALFRLAHILGDIMDNAVSLRPVPYEAVQANDRALTQWIDTLPNELNLDEFRIARSLASPDSSARRLGVQSVIIRTSFYHIRFTLHRPYASAPPPSISPSKPTDSSSATRQAMSLETAVGAADKLITLVGQARPDFLANVSLAVPGHMNWGPFHVFSAAMFFSFQLIANPDQPGASLFRANIRKAISTLDLSRTAPLADKAFDILQALAPLYSAEFQDEPREEREKKKAKVLGMVKTLAFPYHDGPKYPRSLGDSPSAGVYASSPATSNSVSPPGMGTMTGLPQGQPGSQEFVNVTSQPPPSGMQRQHGPSPGSIHMRPAPAQSSSSLATYAAQSAHAQPHPPPPHMQASGMAAPHPHSHSHPPPHSQSMPPPPHPASMHSGSVSASPPSHPSYPQPSQAQAQQMYGDPTRYPYMYPSEDEAMWGPALSQAEWRSDGSNGRGPGP